MSEGLANQIIGGIVGAVATGLIALIAYIYKSRQGKRIIVKRVSETPQIKISEEVRKNLKITYNDQPVDNLVLNTLVVYNNGNEIIEPVEMALKAYPPDAPFKFLEVEVDDPLGKTKIDMIGPGLTISRPYLNPKKKFKEEEIKLALFSNANLDISVEGGGRGWHSQYEEMVGYWGTLPKWVSGFGLLSSAIGIIILLAGFHITMADLLAIPEVHFLSFLFCFVPSAMMPIIGGDFLYLISRRT
jgi:hypothetical protein